MSLAAVPPLQDATPPAQPGAVAPYIQDRIRRGAEFIREDSFKRRLCQLFLKGDTYFYLDNKGALNFLDTAPGVRSGKPNHRVRNRYNFIRPMVDAKVSSSTTRVPGYEVNPTTTDPEAAAASRLSEKVLRMGYEKWNLREMRVKAATLAIGGGGAAYALPYFDSSIGPFRKVGDRQVGEGEIKVLLLNGNEVAWEPGTNFYDSRWYLVRSARPLSEVYALDGYKRDVVLSPDARTADMATDQRRHDMCMVTMYFERPSARHTEGRFLTIANDQQIVPEAPYPMRHKNQVLDEPCIHRLVYRMDPDTDGDLGLTWELIDFQRTLSDIYNKIIEAKNRGLNLRMMAPEGSITKAPTDEPGGIDYFRPVGGFKPEWERAPDPGIIGQLLNVFNRVLEDMRYVAADVDVEAAPNVATGSINAVIQQSTNRWSSFLGDLARFDSSVARHCLMLVQEHYSEKRVLKIKGRFGWEPDASFRGADIMGQVDVTVNPATVETHSRSAMLQQLAWIQANFPGYIRPEVAIEIAMHGASPESVIESFEFDKARVNAIIQAIRDESIMEMPSRQEMHDGPPDPLTGEPTKVPMKIPGWMPRPFDNIDVQTWVFENWLKSNDADRLPEHMHEVAMLIYDGFKHLQAQQQAEAAAAQAAMAESMGMGNAAKPQPQGGKPLPSTPSPTGDSMQPQ